MSDTPRATGRMTRRLGRSSGTGDLTSMSEPMIMAAIPPTARMPKLWTLTSRMNRTIGQEDEPETDVVDGQDLEGEDGQEQGDAAQNARQDGPRVGEFEVQAEEADHEQDVGEVRVGDRQQEPLAEGHRQLDDGLAEKGQGRAPSRRTV